MSQINNNDMNDIVLDIDDEMLGEYLSENEELLKDFNENLLIAETEYKKTPTVSKDIISALFRAMHTIKGSSSFLDCKKITAISHEMETLLQDIREDTMSFTHEAFDILFESADILHNLFDSLRESRIEKGDISNIIDKINHYKSNHDLAAQDNSESIALSEKYIIPFIEETQELLNSIEQMLLEIEKENNQIKPDALQELFRIAHTIKGNAGIFGITPIHQIMHEIEHIFNFFRETYADKTCSITSEALSAMINGCDEVKACIDNIRDNTDEQRDITPILTDLKNIAIALNSTRSQPNTSQTSSEVSLNENMALSQTNYTISLTIDSFIDMKSAKTMLLYERLSSICSNISIEPSIENIPDNTQTPLTITIHCFCQHEQADIENLINLDGIIVESLQYNEPTPAKSTQKKNSAISTDPKQVEQSTIRVDSKKLDALMNLSGELVLKRSQVSRLVNLFNKFTLTQSEFNHTLGNSIKLLNRMQRNITKSTDSTNPTYLRSIIDNILKLVHPITTNIEETTAFFKNNELSNYIRSLDEVVGVLGKITSDIQSTVMQTRMVQIKGLFSRYKRVVRDVSKELGKDILLIMEGEETELDRKVIESLSNPLTHMIRNAIDHGIDSKEERLKRNKKEQGTVTLRASHLGNNISIQVIDDGRGINPETIAQNAIDKGIIDIDTASRLTEEEKFNIMFLPGFSTAKEVTDISGRGVGMDVVKNEISSINGTVEIHSKINHGTTFTIKIPLTLAIIQALLISIDGQILAIPVDNITEVVNLPKQDVFSIDNIPTIKLRNHALSLIELHDIIGLKSKCVDNRDDCNVVVISDGKNNIGVCVDELLLEEEVVIKSLPIHFQHLKGISGATILGDGDIALIIDPVTILDSSRNYQ